MTTWKRTAPALAALLVVLCHSAVSIATPGDLDSSLNGNGFGQLYGSPYGLGAADHGKFIGIGASSAGPSRSATMRRYFGDGAWDQSFGVNGEIDLSDSDGDLVAESIATDSEGRIVVAVSVRDPSTKDFVAAELRRYQPDGTPDESFGTDGVLVTSSDGSRRVSQAALDSQDRIVTVTSEDNDTVVRRYTSDGELDPGFSGDGKAQLPSTTNSYKLAVASDDSIIVAEFVAEFLSGGGGSWIFSLDLSRLTASGAEDKGFGIGGGPRLGGYYPQFVGAGPAGTVFAGIGDNFGGELAGFDLAGDETFSLDLAAYDLAVDPQGRLLVRFFEAPAEGFERTTGILRLLPDGTPDPTFGVDGRTYLYRDGHPVEFMFGGASLISEPEDESTIAILGDPLVRIRNVDSGPADLDADGIVDREDACRWLQGPMPSGCPRFEPELRMWREDRAGVGGRFHGAITVSGSPACEDGVMVRILRVRPGPDRVVGEVTAVGDVDRYGILRRGNIKLVGPVRPGSYYAQVRKHRGPSGICAQAKSVPVRVEGIAAIGFHPAITQQNLEVGRK